jgi:hypothetical protein
MLSPLFKHNYIILFHLFLSLFLFLSIFLSLYITKIEEKGGKYKK